MRKYEDIKIEKDGEILGYDKLTHPAFGMVSFSRVSGGNSVLFGSSINHDEKIILRVRHGEECRGLSRDTYHGTKEILELEMSYSQFAECITAMNIGDGVPCTLTFTEKEGCIPMISENISKRQQFQDEFAEHLQESMGDIQAQIRAIQESLNTKKNLGIKDKEEIIRKLEKAKSNIGCNLNFITKQFDEQMDKTVNEAKGEVEAFVQNKLLSIGSQAIVEKKTPLKLESPIRMDSFGLENKNISNMQTEIDDIDLD